MIEVTNLTKSFGEVRAVQQVSFAAPNGKITGLLGPNGAGKSTTMGMIAGILSPDEGTAQVDGYDASRQRALLESHAKLEDIHRRLAALTEQARERGRDTSRLRADDEHVIAIQRALLASEQTWTG